MPIYDFKCSKCGTIKEALVKSTEGPYEVWCPKCDSPMDKEEVQLSNFQLKGSGWYKDGYSSAKKT